jgi:hypothetical protein
LNDCIKSIVLADEDFCFLFLHLEVCWIRPIKNSLFSFFSIKKILLYSPKKKEKKHWYPTLASSSTEQNMLIGHKLHSKNICQNPNPSLYQKQKNLISSYINLREQPILTMLITHFVAACFTKWEKERVIWGGYSPRRGIQNGNKDTQSKTWQLFLLLQLFICLWYLELLLACCGSPITLATKLNNIPLPSTFTYYFCWFSSLFHILFVEGSTFGSHFQSMLLWLFFINLNIIF